MKDKFSFFLRFFFTFALLFVLFRFVPYRDFIATLKTANVLYIILGFVVFIAVNAIAAMRWKYIMGKLGIVVPYKEACLSFLSSYFFNLFFPSFIAGDIFRVVSISRRYSNTNIIASSVFMDRFSGALSLALVAAVSAIIGRERIAGSPVPGALAILFLIIGAAGIIVLTRKPFHLFVSIFKGKKIHSILVDFHDRLYFFRENPKYLIMSIFISAPIHILTAYYFYINGIGFNVHTGFINYLIAVPILMAISLIPVTIAGVGTREAASIYFLGLVGVAKTVSMSLSLMVLFFTILFGIIGGVIYLLCFHHLITVKDIQQSKC